MRKKRLISFITATITAISIGVMAFAQPILAKTFEPTGFSVESDSVYMVNLDIDAPVYIKDENKQLCPASLTKIMTATLVLETIPPADLEKVIVCPEEIMNDSYWNIMGASRSGFKAGEEVSIRNLLYALVIQSSCEIGDVLGDYVGKTYLNGSLETFIEKMNERATELGCKNTVFKNTHGLHADGQLSTAYDMYLMTKHALTVPEFEDIASTDVMRVAATNKNPEIRSLINTNDMIFKGRPDFYYKGLSAVKTGTTGENTQNLVTTASKNGYRYMVILFGAPFKDEEENRTYSTYNDTKNLYDWAFSTFVTTQVVKAGDTASGAEVPIRLSTAKKYTIAVPKENVSLLLPKTIEIENIKISPTLPPKLDAPLESGVVIGTADLKLDGEILATFEMVSNETIERSTMLFIFDQIYKFFCNSYVQIGLFVLVVLFAIYLVIAIHRRKKQKAALARAKHKK